MAFISRCGRALAITGAVLAAVSLTTVPGTAYAERGHGGNGRELHGGSGHGGGHAGRSYRGGHRGGSGGAAIGLGILGGALLGGAIANSYYQPYEPYGYYYPPAPPAYYPLAGVPYYAPAAPAYYPPTGAYPTAGTCWNSYSQSYYAC